MYEDLDRPPLHLAGLRRALCAPRGGWAGIDVVVSTGSTNADLLAAARAGAPDRTVLVAEEQRAGRGRLSRQWSSPPRAGLTLSVLLRPGSAVPVRRWGWLPLLTGVVLARVVARLGELDAVLKWPNDLLLGPGRGKAAGILAELTGDAVVIGLGLNVLTRPDELPPGATSLAAEQASCTDRDPLLRALLRALDADERRWREAGGDAQACGLRAGYRAACATLGQRVRVTLPEGAALEGEAADVDPDGRLVLRTAGGERAVAAGDVVHLRPVP